MSSFANRKYKIALFVGGLCCDGSFFNETIKLLNDEKPNSVIEYNGIIDLTDFNVLTEKFYGINDGSICPSNSSLTNFCKKISTIVELSTSNIYKTVLVRTKLDRYIDCVSNGSIKYRSHDSIDNQAIKLKKIIKDIKNLNSQIDIILIGHSQGGLVNLKVSTLIPSYISDMISISTPYSPVTIAYLLRGIEFAANLFNQSIVSKFDPLEYEDYLECVNTLSNKTYFTNLKNKWNTLNNRPHLTIISGVSAHLMTSQSFTIFNISFETNFRYPFDGLVLGREQVSIENADINVLHEDGVTCYEESNGFTNPCCVTVDINHNHNCDCILPCFDINDVLLQSSLSSLDLAIHNGQIDISQLPIIKAIIEGIDGIPCSNENYRQYYELIGGRFSHKNIIKQEETIGIILGIFAK